jgi:hypothetical protein
MIQEKIVRHDLLYHSAHGLCRVNELIKENHSGKEVLRYSLVPRLATKMKVRFVIQESDMEASGFHPLVPLKEANKILGYLKAGDATAGPFGGGAQDTGRSMKKGRAWCLAQEILASSHQHWDPKDKKARQLVEHSVKGLVGELACVFKLTLQETAARIRQCLGGAAKINPWVLDALEQAGDA